jgi:hypothetical protein
MATYQLPLNSESGQYLIPPFTKTKDARNEHGEFFMDTGSPENPQIEKLQLIISRLFLFRVFYGSGNVR